MKVLLQRVTQASVEVDGRVIGEIESGLLALVGVGRDDTVAVAQRLATKTATLRIFADDVRLMNRSVRDVGGAVLAVSQFTLYGDARRGNRPSFTQAAPPEQGQAVYDAYVAALRNAGLPVQTGVFGAHMTVALVNDGPVTVMLEG